MKLRALLFLFLFCSRPVFADGAYKHLLLAEPAQIPRQSAAVSFADGKETLTIWNTVEAKGQDLAWVLPLPAKPEVIRPSHPNAFKLLQLLTAPNVKAGNEAGSLGVVFLLLLGLCLMLVKRSRRRWLLPAAIVFLLLFAVLMISPMTDNFSRPRGWAGGPVAGVEVLSVQDVGKYETIVISGTSAEAVNEWLRGAGFPVFTGGDAQVLESYVAKQWVFLCSRLRTTASGPSAGHPLSVRFAVEKPVYPMSLTKSAGTVPVEIFWMGKPVRDLSGRLNVTGITADGPYERFRGLHYELDMTNLAKAAHDIAGDESLEEHYTKLDRDLLLDQMLLSTDIIRFTANFTPASDWSDLQFDPVSETPKLPRHVTRGWLYNTAMADGAFGATAVFILLGFAAQLCGKPGTRPHIAWTAAGLVSLLGAAGWAWSRLPKDVVIVENSQVTQPKVEGPDSPEAMFHEWCSSLNRTKAPP